MLENINVEGIEGPCHMRGILYSLSNEKAKTGGGFQSTDDNYIGTINVTTPRRRSFKVMRPLDDRLEDGFPAS